MDRAYSRKLKPGPAKNEARGILELVSPLECPSLSAIANTDRVAKSFPPRLI
jgi:hypothetical protein